MRRVALPATLAAVLVLTGSLTSCGGDPVPIDPQGVDELEIPTPSADPDDFVDAVDNLYLPLAPGSRWVYRQSGPEVQTITVTVTDETRVVQGVTTTVVHDVVTGPDGEVVEDTYDWFAQDTDGNVWYFGEETVEYDAQGHGDTEGSWEAGVDGAQAGVAMLAVPRVGDGYEQEHLEGVAEDRATVLTLDQAVNVAFGTFQDVLETEETTPLEPDQVERKYYAAGIGVVYEEKVGTDEAVELVEFTAG